jgi:predicted kinase
LALVLESLLSHHYIEEVGVELVGAAEEGAAADGPRFYLLVGIPGSGKTTYARRHLAGALRLSLDDLRLMLTGVAYDARYESMVVSVAHAALGAMLARARAWGHDILLDATNTTRDRRRFYLQMAARHDLPVVAIHFDCPLELALARDAARPNPVGEEVVRRFHAQLQPPTLAEGFAQVITVAASGA